MTLYKKVIKLAYLTFSNGVKVINSDSISMWTLQVIRMIENIKNAGKPIDENNFKISEAFINTHKSLYTERYKLMSGSVGALHLCKLGFEANDFLTKKNLFRLDEKNSLELELTILYTHMIENGIPANEQCEYIYNIYKLLNYKSINQFINKIVDKENDKTLPLDNNLETKKIRVDSYKKRYPNSQLQEITKESILELIKEHRILLVKHYNIKDIDEISDK